ncbi:IS3 family transposase [Marinilactibacillus sp. Marseille-P9653]
MDYVHWWNHFRSHGSLDYESPIDYRKKLGTGTV